MENKYIAGVCNIGPQEINRRKQIGWVGLAMTIILLAVFLWLKLNPLFRLLIFFPATFSASGFLQAYLHFCSGFARMGVFNFDDIGKQHAIEDRAQREKDQKRSNQIIMYAVLIGLVIAIISAIL